MRAPYFKLSFTKHPKPVTRPALTGVAVDPAASQLLTESEPTNNDLIDIEAEVNVNYNELMDACTDETA